MICKIQPPNPNISSAIDYNEKKMNGVEGIRPHEADPSLEAIEDGHVLATRNVPEGSTLMDEFQRLQLNAMKMSGKRGPAIRNTTFHMSVNPSATDRPLGDQEAVGLIDELMSGLGYASQPYRIYKHTDIARAHYHVVTSRIGQDGKKIKADYEYVVLRKKLRELEEKYGFEVILNEDEKAVEEKIEKKTKDKDNAHEEGRTPEKKTGGENPQENKPKKQYVPAFSRKSEVPVTEQMRNIYEDAMKWSFTTFQQLQHLLLRRYNVLAEIEQDGSEGTIKLAGVDSREKIITPPIGNEETGLDLMRLLRERMDSTKMSQKREQRTRIEALAQAAADAAPTWDAFVRTMEKKGVWVVMSWTADGKPFGVTWLDRATKCAWKASETSRPLSWLLATAERKGWTITRDERGEVISRRAAMPSRQDALRPATRTDTPTTPRAPRKPSVGRQLESALRSGARSANAHGTVGGKQRDIFDEIEEEKLREEQQRSAAGIDQ